jgi:hypothetical protein
MSFGTLMLQSSNKASRRHLRTTELTIQQIKQSTCERIFRRDVQILERFAETLRSLNGFTQELPRILDALLELTRVQIHYYDIFGVAIVIE